MGRKRLVYDKECTLLFASNIFEGVKEDYPWFESFINNNPSVTRDDIKGKKGIEDFFNNRYDEIIKQAVSEWSSHLIKPVEVKKKEDNIRCDLCNHRIINICNIVNSINGKELKVGIECVKHFGMTFEKDLKKLIIQQKRFRRISLLEKEISGIENEIHGWNDEVDIVPILLPNWITQPYKELGEKAKNLFEGFIERSSAEADQKDIILLKNIIQTKKTQVRKIKQYITENASDIFIPNRRIVNWVEVNARMNPEKHGITLDWLKEDGKIKMRTAWRIGEEEYLRSLVPKFNKYLKHVGWNVDGLIQYRGFYGYEVHILKYQFLVFCGYEDFIREFGENIFQEDADIRLDIKRLIEMCTIHISNSVSLLLQIIEEYIPQNFRIYFRDEMMDEIIFEQNDMVLKQRWYYKKSLREFIEKFKYSLIESEREKQAVDIKSYFAGSNKWKRDSKQDISAFHPEIKLKKEEEDEED